MQYFRRIGPGLIAACALAGASPVFAAGTDANTEVVNSVSLEYTVGGGPAITETADATFRVDQKLALDVTATDTNYVGVSPGQEFTGGGVPALNFTVENTGNSATNVLLGVVDQNGTGVTGFAGPPTGPTFTSFNDDALLVAIDTNGNGLYDDGVDVILTPSAGVYDLNAGLVAATLGTDLAEDQTVTILVVADVPAAAASDEIATYSLVATHYTGAQVALTGDDNGNDAPGFTGATDIEDDPATVQIVFADVGPFSAEDLTFDFATPAAGTTVDIASNGQDSDSSSFVIIAAGILLEKVSQIIWDPVSDEQTYDGAGAISGDFPKSIPGAVVMYVIAAKNTALTGGASTALAFLRDDVPQASVTVGNASAEVLNLPASFTVDVDSGPDVENVTLTLPGSIDDDLITVIDCNGSVTSQAFAADPTEVDVTASTLGSCDAQETAYVVYFVTINDA